MRSVLSLNHTDKHQSSHGNFSTCIGSNEKVLSRAEEFYYQLFSVVFFSKPDSTSQVIFILIIFISIVGMVGNGCVIWLLGFCIKRNKFTTYVLNLAIADFVTLMGLSAFNVLEIITTFNVAGIQTMQLFFGQFFNFSYCVSLYLLTAIGVERCFSILFPIWVHCQRPNHLSTTVSVLSWIVSALMTVTEFLLHYFCLIETWIMFLRILFGVNLFIFTPIMVVSTLILFIKMSFRHQPGKLHIVMLIIILFFIITTVPYSTFFLLCIIDYKFHVIAIPVYDMLIALNNSINPIIYFFIGNQCKCQSWDSIKVVFQRIFKDEIKHAERN
nr:mas-related G-protein coupled receptor member H-like [Anolis sagrei ordinatus]